MSRAQALFAAIAALDPQRVAAAITALNADAIAGAIAGEPVRDATSAEGAGVLEALIGAWASRVSSLRESYLSEVRRERDRIPELLVSMDRGLAQTNLGISAAQLNRVNVFRLRNQLPAQVLADWERYLAMTELVRTTRRRFLENLWDQRAGLRDIFAQLIGNGADVGRANRDGCMLLLLAARAGCWEIAVELINVVQGRGIDDSCSVCRRLRPRVRASVARAHCTPGHVGPRHPIFAAGAQL